MNVLGKQEADNVIHQLHKDGHRAYFVGGAVRDELLQRHSSDIDITTSAKPAEICLLFARAHQMNTQHQTVLVRSGNIQVEVTTERGGSLEDDLLHRDFTMNAMAKTVDGTLIDPCNGQKDLQNRMIRSLHPKERMMEDPLRMLRAIRFVSELDFEIDPKLLSVLKQQAYLLKEVAQERVLQEWEKLLKGVATQKAFRYLKRTTLFRYLPGFSLSNKEMEKLITMPKWDQPNESIFAWVLFLIWIDKDSEETLRMLLLSNEKKRQIKVRVQLFYTRQTEQLDDWMLYQSGFDVAQDVEEIRRILGLDSIEPDHISKRWDALPIQSRQELCISGRDLLKSQQQAGPWIKQELEWLEYQVINCGLHNEKQDLLQCIERKRLDEK